MNPYVINEALSCFHGTSMYYKHQLFPNLFLSLTDGCDYLRNACNCYWLFDLMLSYQKQLKANDFQVWKLSRIKGDEFNIVCEDGNNSILLKQHIPFSDFPLNNISIWLINGVAMLPSEY